MNVLITDTGSVFGHALAMEYLNTGAQVFGISKRPNDQLNKYANYDHLKLEIVIWKWHVGNSFRKYCQHMK